MGLTCLIKLVGPNVFIFNNQVTVKQLLAYFFVDLVSQPQRGQTDKCHSNIVRRSDKR